MMTVIVPVYHKRKSRRTAAEQARRFGVNKRTVERNRGEGDMIIVACSNGPATARIGCIRTTSNADSGRQT
jgi:hypothetical protein